MLFWIREIAGWMLVLLALFLLNVGINYVTSTKIVQAGVIMFTAMGVMRIGILLIRISTAARICLKEDPPPRK